MTDDDKVPSDTATQALPPPLPRKAVDLMTHVEAVEPGATYDLDLEATEDFFWQKLQLDRAEAQHFELVMLRLGPDAIIDTSSGGFDRPVPLEHYADAGIGLWVQKGVKIAMRVRNQTDEPHSLTLRLC